MRHNVVDTLEYVNLYSPAARWQSLVREYSLLCGGDRRAAAADFSFLEHILCRWLEEEETVANDIS